jgi:hypothetical protein
MACLAPPHTRTTKFSKFTGGIEVDFYNLVTMKTPVWSESAAVTGDMQIVAVRRHEAADFADT